MRTTYSDDKNTTIKRPFAFLATISLAMLMSLALGASAFATSYSITYDSNVVSGMPSDTTSSSFTEAVPISDAAPTRSGYAFNGWCTVAPVNDSCSGTTYAAGSNWSINQTTTSNTLHLFAMWGPIPTMQEFAAGTASTTCSAMSQGDTLTLKDSRDGTEYRVGKLADDKCWMLDNLAFDAVANLSKIDATNTDINGDSTTQAAILSSLKETGGNRSAGNQYSTAGISYWTSSYSYSAPLIAIKNASNDSWSPMTVPSDATSTAGSYKVGVYYNYCAASAGSYCYGSGTSAGSSSGNASSSICPKGWRMPTGDTIGEFNALYTNSNYNTYANYRAALHLPLSGYFYSGSASDQGSYGSWWSSTRRNNNRMYLLFANTSLIYPSDNSGRDDGYSLRCILGS